MKIKEGITVEKVVSFISDEYDGFEKTEKEDVFCFISSLIKAGIADE